MNPVMVVLTAGDGGRLGRQKTLLEFSGRALIEHILDAWAHEAVVLVGYQADEIRERLAGRDGVHYVVCDRWAETKPGDSLLLPEARDYWVGRDCLIVSGDHLYGPRMIEWLMTRPAGTCVLADADAPLDGEETVLIGNDDGTDTQLVYPASRLDGIDGLQIQGECPELFRISAEDTRRLPLYLEGCDVFEAINLVPKVRWFPVDEPWIEIDTPEDLERARGVWERISGS